MYSWLIDIHTLITSDLTVHVFELQVDNKQGLNSSAATSTETREAKFRI